MKLDSKYFDYVRVKPDQNRLLREQHPCCQWQSCHEPGEFRAPQGRGREGKYFQFCLAHVQAYNKAYNYFQGMSDTEVTDYQKSAVTGHRPTWALGSNSGAADGPARAKTPWQLRFERLTRSDPHNLLGSEGPSRPEAARRIPVGRMALKSLKALNLDEHASKVEIKARFKELVKRHHPDANGGDKGSEDRLREIIQAYNHLKQAGLC